MPIVAAAASSPAKSKIKPARVGDNTFAVRSMVLKTAFILANLFSSPEATITIQSLSMTILQPTDARFATLETTTIDAGIIHGAMS